MSVKIDLSCLNEVNFDRHYLLYAMAINSTAPNVAEDEKNETHCYQVNIKE